MGLAQSSENFQKKFKKYKWDKIYLRACLCEMNSFIYLIGSNINKSGWMYIFPYEIKNACKYWTFSHQSSIVSSLTVKPYTLLFVTHLSRYYFIDKSALYNIYNQIKSHQILQIRVRSPSAARIGGFCGKEIVLRKEEPPFLRVLGENIDVGEILLVILFRMMACICWR